MEGQSEGCLSDVGAARGDVFTTVLLGLPRKASKPNQPTNHCRLIIQPSTHLPIYQSETTVDTILRTLT